MKINFSILLFILSFSVSFCQDTTFNYNLPLFRDTVFKKGIYRSFNEMLNNAPSDTEAFTFKERITFPPSVLEHDSDKKNIKDATGFCNGNKIYIRYENNYYELEIVGPYCYFSYSVTTTVMMNGAVMPSVSFYEYIVDTKARMIYKLNKNMMKEVLTPYSNLSNAYSLEKNKKQKYKEYIKKINHEILSQA